MNYDDMDSRANELADLAADELNSVMASLGIGFMACVADHSDDTVAIAFAEIEDAEAFMTLGVTQEDELGSLYDRATSSCLTLMSIAAEGEADAVDQVEAAIDAGWTWQIHPAMIGRRMGWHVRLDMPVSDATTVAANLHAVRLGLTR